MSLFPLPLKFWISSLIIVTYIAYICAHICINASSQVHSVLLIYVMDLGMTAQNWITYWALPLHAEPWAINGSQEREKRLLYSWIHLWVFIPLLFPLLGATCSLSSHATRVIWEKHVLALEQPPLTGDWCTDAEEGTEGLSKLLCSSFLSPCFFVSSHSGFLEHQTSGLCLCWWASPAALAPLFLSVEKVGVDFSSHLYMSDAILNHWYVVTHGFIFTTASVKINLLISPCYRDVDYSVWTTQGVTVRVVTRLCS